MGYPPGLITPTYHARLAPLATGSPPPGPLETPTPPATKKRRGIRRGYMCVDVDDGREVVASVGKEVCQWDSTHHFEVEGMLEGRDGIGGKGYDTVLGSPGPLSHAARPRSRRPSVSSSSITGQRPAVSGLRFATIDYRLLIIPCGQAGLRPTRPEIPRSPALAVQSRLKIRLVRITLGMFQLASTYLASWPCLARLGGRPSWMLRGEISPTLIWREYRGTRGTFPLPHADSFSWSSEESVASNAIQQDGSRLPRCLMSSVGTCTLPETTTREEGKCLSDYGCPGALLPLGIAAATGTKKSARKWECLSSPVRGPAASLEQLEELSPSRNPPSKSMEATTRIRVFRLHEFICEVADLGAASPTPKI
ncbi:unnamed protein product [Diplocarpon coronariae]